jgi:DNA-directed RNA polymerase specialized sigma24 family protein
MEGWAAELQSGRPDAAWDLFLDRYRRLIFAAIRHYAQDYDDVTDVFARVCEALRADDLGRLRTYTAQPDHRARFSTWLVVVVRHVTVDWFRHRDGRRRLSVVAEALPPLRRRIFEHVFLDQRSHIEAYELIHAREAPALSFTEFLGELRATYSAVTDGRRGRVLGELGGMPPAEDESAAPSSGDIAETSALLDQALGSLSPEDRAADRGAGRLDDLALLGA